MIIYPISYWKKSIRDEVPFVDVKPYSHNLINLALQNIANAFGDEEANKAIEEFGLERLGWAKKIVLDKAPGI